MLSNAQDRLSYLRALAINTLINEAVEVFIKNEELILEGKFHQALLDKSRYEAQINSTILRFSRSGRFGNISEYQPEIL